MVGPGSIKGRAAAQCPLGGALAPQRRHRVPVYVVAQGRVKNRDMLNEYVAKAVSTIQASGGRVLGFDESPEVVEGVVEHPRTVILEFPSHEAFREWYNSDAYQTILPLRLESTPGTLIVVNGLPSS